MGTKNHRALAFLRDLRLRLRRALFELRTSERRKVELFMEWHNDIRRRAYSDGYLFGWTECYGQCAELVDAQVAAAIAGAKSSTIGAN